MVFWGMGISQSVHGTDNARCLIALMLMTGNVGKPGTGLHPLRGQNNVQGASDAGLIPIMYPDYQRVGDPRCGRSSKPRGASISIPTRDSRWWRSWAQALAGDIKGMYMMGENPFLSDPNVNKVRKALANLDFLVVQDIFLTETAEFADVILPATTHLEKVGTYTNTDRRVQVGRKALHPPGSAREDWKIVSELSTAFGYPMSYDSSVGRVRRDDVPRPFLRRAHAREPGTDRKAVAVPRPGDGRHRRSCSATRSRRPTGWDDSCRPSSRRPRSRRTRSIRSSSTRAGCSSTGTRER